MKYIQLQIWQIQKANGERVMLNYKEQFLRVVEAFDEGATIDTLRKYFDLNAKLRAVDDLGMLELENAEYDLLLAKLKSQKWAFFAMEILAMVDAVEKASSVKPLDAVLDEKALEAKG